MVGTPVGTVRTLCFGFEAKEKEPVLFDLHGGGFVMHSADVDIKMCRYFRENCHCKVVSIDYAKAPEHPYPQAVNEVYEVVKYFTAHAKEGAIPPKIAAAFDACYLPDDSYEECPYVSPVFSKKEDMIGLPGALVIAAGYDSLHDEAVHYYKLLCEANVPAQLLEYPDSAHAFTMKESPDSADALQKMADFLNARFK